MVLSARAKKLVAEITNGNVKLGDLKQRGKEIKKDHDLAMELWSTGEYYPRLLATLIFDKKLLAESVIDQLASDMLRHDAEERNQLADWLLANQLAKDKKLVSLIATWRRILPRFCVACSGITKLACAGSGKLLPGIVQTCLIPWKTIWLTLNLKFNGR